jgi:hypothetical protein
MPPCYGAPWPARVRLDRRRTDGPPHAQCAYGMATGRRVAWGNPKRLGVRRQPGEGVWPMAARDLGRRGVGRRAGADAEGADARARCHSATSRRRARPTHFQFAKPQFEHDLLQNFE